MSNLSKIEDTLSGGLSVALKFLGTEQPMRTSLGLFLGIVLNGFFRFFEDLLQLSVSVSFDSANHIFFLAVGVLIMYSSVVLDYINPKREEVFDENLDKVFAALRKILRDGKIDPIARRRLYEQIAQAVIDRLNLKDELKKEIQEQIVLSSQDSESS